MDGGWSDPAGWRSSIPGVSQREGAAASLGIVTTGGRMSPPADTGATGDSQAGRGGVHRGGRALPWRAVGLAVMGLAAILGLARVAGNVGAGQVGAVWQWGREGERERVAGRVAGSAPMDGGLAAAATGVPSPVAEPSASGEPSAASGEPGGSAQSGASAVPTSGDVLLAEPPNWWAVLAELDTRRSAALAALDLDSLAEHALPGSPAWDADAALLADLQEQGLRPDGLTSRVLAVERVERQGVRAQVQIVDQRSAYALVDARGEVVDRVEAAPRATWSVSLQQREADRGWRIVEVISASGSDEPSPAEGEEVP